MTPPPIKVNRPTAKVTFDNVVCSRCEMPVKMVMSQDLFTNCVGTLQPDEGLHLTNHYGYGMWRDHNPDGESSRQIIICGHCTEQFFEDNPWLRAYLEQE